MDPARESLAKRYARLQRAFSVSEMALAASYLVAAVQSGLWFRLNNSLALPHPASVALMFTVLLAGYAVLDLPLSYYRGLTLPRRYGLSKQDFLGWLGVKARESLLEWLLGTAAASGIYTLLSIMPDWWWLAAGIFTALVSGVLSFLAPWVLLPLFFKTKPLPKGDLRQRLESLAARAGFQPAGIFSIDMSRRGTTANAMFLGMGRSRRIVLTDTLVDKYSPEEIETILAHELGHYRMRHVAKLLAFQSGLVLVMFLLTHLTLRALATPGGRFGLQGPADLAGLPLLMLIMLASGLALSPALMAFSRLLESHADTFALRLTDNPAAFVQALRRLHEQNLIEANPSRVVEWLFYDHPPLARRLERVQREQGRSPGAFTSPPTP